MSKSQILHKIDLMLARLSSSALIVEQAASSASASASSSLDDDIGVSHNLLKLEHTVLSFKDTLLQFDRLALLGYRTVQETMRKIKLILDDAEIMLDDLHHSHSLESLPRKQIYKLINKVGHLFFSRFSSSHATQINDITHRLQYLVSRMIETTDALYAYGMQSSHLYGFPYYESDVTEEESHVVIGRQTDKEVIIEKLLMMHQQQHNHDEDDQSTFSILPIFGMQGMGKTTLAKIVFRDKRIRESFSVCIWVWSFLAFHNEKIVIQMINSASSFDVTTYQLTMTQLQHHLENIFVGRKFLLVLDDVQKEHPLKWDEVRNLIQIGANGSKVLLTSCIRSIASMIGTIPSHNLEPLSLKDSLSLFEKLASKAEAYKYPELIELGREIVKRCVGVPLAIEVMGSMLFSQDMIVGWELMRENDFRDLPKDHGFLTAIRVGYDYMPFHLKQCFELFSLYPNDFVFHSSELVSLWAALDLLHSPNIDETLIDVSYQYLQKIIPRIFFKEFVNFGTSYYFQIHDLILDIARDMTKYGCLMINSNNQDIHQNVEHLSFVINNLLDKSFSQKHANVRGILFPIEGVGATSELFWNTCLSRCKYLRILDLSDSTYEVLPSSIGKLRHLRFFSLERNEKIKRVPDSICKLQHLQVLNLAGCKELETLPKRLGNLANLRQLGITTKESTLPENDIAKLGSLEFLRIECCDKLESFFVGKKLPYLKTLEVINCGNLKYLPLDIDHFPQLETLLVDNCDYLELIEEHDDQSSILQLKAIHLHSLQQLMGLPCWLQKSTNTLLCLLIVDCKNVDVLPEWLSTFCVMRSFGIINCPKLMSLPNDIHRLVALEYFRIEECPELCRKCQPNDGEYWSKISHIKQIFIDKPEDLKQEEEESKEA